MTTRKNPAPPSPADADPAIAGSIGRTSGGRKLRSLRDAETLRALIGGLREGVYISNVTGQVLDANQAFLDILGVKSLDDLAQVNAFDLFVDPQQRVRELEILLRQGAVRDFEIELRRPDGQRRTAIDTCTMVADAETDEVLFHGVLVDITDRKAAERAREESEANFRALIEQSAEAIYVIQDLNIVLVNSAWERLFGYTRVEIEQGSFDCRRVVAPESMALINERLSRITNGEKPPARYDLKGLAKGGEIMDLACHVTEIAWRGRPATQGIYHDVTDIKVNADKLSRTLSLLSATLESTADGILVVDSDGKIATFNRRFVEMWRMPGDVVVAGDDERSIGFVLDQVKDPEAFSRKVRELYATPDAESYDEIEFRDGRVFERYSLPQKLEGRYVGRVWSFRDVTARKTAEMRLVHDAFHDALTSLPNRSLFTDLLSRSIGRSRRRAEYKFGLLFLDIDRFKVVNDSLGHMIGDELLTAVARRLERCVRPGDTVARLGGDEFTVLLDDIEDPSDATRIANRIQHELNLPFTLSGQEVFTSASIGIALSNGRYEHPDDMLRDADIAMYRAKALGKARYEIFDAEMRARAIAQLQLETDLRRALDREEFRVMYQPVFSLVTDRLVGFEALVRWDHPQRGIVLPEEFVTAAEETGLIVSIGRMVLGEACRQLHEWRIEFPDEAALTISVNLSGRQFRQPDLVDHVAQCLGETDLKPGNLRLEITESSIIENAASAGEMLGRLRGLGVKVDLDDFGTGYSSLSYLHKFEMDALKIDRGFVDLIDRPGEKSKSEIVRTIVDLARGMQMEVIAEGVERPEQLRILRGLGCGQVQGYLLGRPLTAAAVPELLGRSIEGRRGGN
jgi:diguanylate cyclase (GGDEF)-like protein/PAS domain S-box-containing protein